MKPIKKTNRKKNQKGKEEGKLQRKQSERKKRNTNNDVFVHVQSVCFLILSK